MFLTSPQDYPSGVSAGHIIPQWVLWSYLGLAIFPVFFNGVLILLKWLNVEVYVILLKDYATPYFATSPLAVIPQFPVARACLSAWVIVSWCIS